MAIFTVPSVNTQSTQIQWIRSFRQILFCVLLFIAQVTDPITGLQPLPFGQTRSHIAPTWIHLWTCDGKPVIRDIIPPATNLNRGHDSQSHKYR